MKARGRGSHEDPPQALVDALDDLERQWGPHALREAMKRRRSHGRPKRYSERIDLAVWLAVQIEMRLHGLTKTAACKVLAKRAVIDEMTEGVGFTHAPPEWKKAQRKRWDTWYSRHTKGARVLKARPEQLALYEGVIIMRA